MVSQDEEALNEFERTLQSLVETRKREEAIYNELAKTEASKFFSLAAYQPQEAENVAGKQCKHASCLSFSNEVTSNSVNYIQCAILFLQDEAVTGGKSEVQIDYRTESAALKIQYFVRRWLYRKDMGKSSQWTRSLLQHKITESRYYSAI